jgi:hypothetical protein
VRIKHYHYLGTIGTALSAFGFYLLTKVTVDTSPLQVTEALVIVGAGLGVTFPIYITAVQSAVDRRFLGVVSSNTQFWRNVGGTVATAIFGSILASRLPVNIKAQVAALHLPPQFASSFSGGAATSPQQLFDAASIAATRAKLPAAVQPIFDQVLTAVRAGLAQTLRELFLIGLVAIVLAVVASLFMPDVPLRGTQPAPLAEPAPVPIDSEAEPEPV